MYQYDFKTDLKSSSDYMFGKATTSEKRPNESPEQHEQRVWKEKVHVNRDGQLFIPPFAFKNGLESAGAWLSMKIQGEGKKTYTARLRSGVLIVEPVLLFNDKGKPLTIDDVDPMRLFVPSDGKRGGQKRVHRIFPTISYWQGTLVGMVFDEKIAVEILQRHMTSFGQYIGVGSMRVQNGGINGRFEVSEIIANEMMSEVA